MSLPTRIATAFIDLARAGAYKGAALVAYLRADGTTDNVQDVIRSVETEAALKVPYTGATADLNLGAHNLTASGATIGTLDGLLKAASGVVGAATVGSSLSYAAGTLDAIQDIRTSASPGFAGLTLTGDLTGGSTSTPWSAIWYSIANTTDWTNASFLLKRLSDSPGLAFDVQRSDGVSLFNVDKSGFMAGRGGFKFDQAGSAIERIFTKESANWACGTAAYMSSANTVSKAKADAAATAAGFIGLLRGPSATTTAIIVTYGCLNNTSTADTSWTAVTGSEHLTPGALYYVSTTDAGMITTTRPTTGFVRCVGVALSDHIMWVDSRIDAPPAGLTDTIGWVDGDSATHSVEIVNGLVTSWSIT